MCACSHFDPYNPALFREDFKRDAVRTQYLGICPCTCVKMEPFVLLAFLPQFYSSFASTSAISPLKRSVLGAWKGHFQARKGQMVNSGLQDPETTWNAYKTSENVTRPQLASLQGLASTWAKNCCETGEKRQNDTWQMVPFSRAHSPPLLTGGQDLQSREKRVAGSKNPTNWVKTTLALIFKPREAWRIIGLHLLERLSKGSWRRFEERFEGSFGWDPSKPFRAPSWDPFSDPFRDPGVLWQEMKVLTIGSSPELCVQSPCVRNGQGWEVRKGALLHPKRCPLYVSIVLSFV